MKNLIASLLLVLFTLIGCHSMNHQNNSDNKTASPLEQNKGLKQATFAGGCYWCMEAPFEKADGVVDVRSGYTGGAEENPTYEDVASGRTGHVEAIQITFNEAQISYQELLEIFWRQIDPTDNEGQFVDRGDQYKTAIFYHDDQQKTIAEKSKDQLAQSGRFENQIVTPILPYLIFYQAEDYHQDYYKKNRIKYKFYRSHSGRDQYLEKTWGNEKDSSINLVNEKFEKPSPKELQKKLSPLQYKVTQKNGTEPAFNNEYWDNKREGIYVDIVSGEPLFSSVDKYDSKTGWPSFSRPIEEKNIIEQKDRSLFTVRTEVRSAQADSHLGHRFPDGPPPAGNRYCVNSASLRFIPKEKLGKEGYEKYRSLFIKKVTRDKHEPHFE